MERKEDINFQSLFQR